MTDPLASVKGFLKNSPTADLQKAKAAIDIQSSPGKVDLILLKNINQELAKRESEQKAAVLSIIKGS